MSTPRSGYLRRQSASAYSPFMFSTLATLREVRRRPWCGGKSTSSEQARGLPVSAAILCSSISVADIADCVTGCAKEEVHDHDETAIS
jgi:hypothetical protein